MKSMGSENDGLIYQGPRSIKIFEMKHSAVSKFEIQQATKPQFGDFPQSGGFLQMWEQSIFLHCSK